MRFSTMWYVRPAKPQISLRIRAVWSEPLLVTWIFYECKATDWTSFGVSKLKRRLQRLVWVYTCQNATKLEITCQGSFSKWKIPVDDMGLFFLAILKYVLKLKKIKKKIWSHWSSTFCLSNLSLALKQCNQQIHIAEATLKQG